MAIRTLGEMRTHLKTRIRKTGTTVDAFVTDCLNMGLSEIHYFADWSWLRRKTTLSTVADQEDYRLDEEVDRIQLIRQRTTPHKLRYLPDRVFYRLIPNPEDLGTGNPRYYRQWEETSFETALAADDTIQVLSSNSADGSGFNVRIVGRNTSDVVIAETITLNGTTAVTSTNTWDSGSIMRVSKSANTTGVITVRRTTGATTLIQIGPLEANPRVKIISLYPIPSAVITINLEYLERLHYLVADADVPQMDTQWSSVLTQGALQHLWKYNQDDVAAATARQAFLQGLGQMLKADGATRYDYIPVLQGRRPFAPSVVRRWADSSANDFPDYGVGY